MIALRKLARKSGSTIINCPENMMALKTGVRIWQCNKKLGKEIWQWF
jgi:hypothetical protein